MEVLATMRKLADSMVATRRSGQLLRMFPVILLISALAVLASCAGNPEPKSSELPPAVAPARTSDTVTDRRVIVAFGDSLTAGYGLPPGESYPDHLQKLLDKTTYRFRVVNLGVSGDTTTGGLARVDQAIALKPTIVLLELGGNDGLRGVPVQNVYDNLNQIITRFREARAEVVLIGISLPRNYGDTYIRQFEKNYYKLAQQHELYHVPFLLEGIWTPDGSTPGMIQEDGIHPTAKGTPVMAQTVFKILQKMLKLQPGIYQNALN